MFQPEAYRETAAAIILKHMLARETSSDPAVRQNAHFEGKLTPQAFCELMAKPIDPTDVAFMKSEGYRIVDFGRFSFADVVQALQVYRAHHGHVRVPQDYVITDRVVREMSEFRHADGDAKESEDGANAEWAQFQAEAREADAYWSDLIEASASDDGGGLLACRSASVVKRPSSAKGNLDARRTGLSPAMDASPPLPQYDVRYIGMPLGEAVASLRSGDVDGLEDPVRRPLLDALGFDWGDKSRYQRFRFMPMLLGLKIYRHLYGFPLVKTDFVVPDEPQWPYWMAGTRCVKRFDFPSVLRRDSHCPFLTEFCPCCSFSHLHSLILSAGVLPVSIWNHSSLRQDEQTTARFCDILTSCTSCLFLISTGMPLGEWAAVARVQQAMLREHYPQRVDILNALEFLWWIPPARTLPEKYYEPVE
jgi:hypothetical protein